ncbi:MAG: hypothetical protein AAB923_02335 [Patescibacteria group bacterium]
MPNDPKNKKPGEDEEKGADAPKDGETDEEDEDDTDEDDEDGVTDWTSEEKES